MVQKMTNKKIFLCVVILLTATLTGCVPDKFQFEKEICESGSNSGQLLGGTDIDLTKEGFIVVADSGNKRFQVISPEGTPVLTGGDDKSVHENYKLGSLTGIGVDKVTNDIWVCDQRENKIIRFDSNGKPNLRVTKNVRRPMDVAIGKDGSAYVIMSKKSTIFKYDKNGKFLEAIGGTGKGSMIYPTTITVSNDFIYITDYAGKRILKLDIKGEFVAEFCSKGEQEPLMGPSCLHTDNDGNMYVLDLGEIPIVILSPDGKLISKIGEFGEGKGQFLYPTGILAKSNEDIYVLDNTKNTILNFKKKPDK
jgi:DNA-binding beta-propeller fold protein YncE